jgi:hypothetical protein
MTTRYLKILINILNIIRFSLVIILKYILLKVYRISNLDIITVLLRAASVFLGNNIKLAVVDIKTNSTIWFLDK